MTETTVTSSAAEMWDEIERLAADIGVVSMLCRMLRGSCEVSIRTARDQERVIGLDLKDAMLATLRVLSERAEERER